MQPPNALDSITLEAFQAALDTCRARDIELPEAIQAVATDLPSHIDQLDDLSELGETFEAFYKAERLAIQTSSARRPKRLFPTDASPQPAAQPAVEDAPHPGTQDRPETFINHFEGMTIGNFANHPLTQDRPETLTTPAPSEPFPNPQKPNSKTTEPTAVAPQTTRPAPTLKRFVLPGDATEGDRQYFQTYIAELKQLNPRWRVTRDRCKTGESDAYIMILNNEDYQLNYAAYIGSNMINDFFSGLKL